MIVTRVTSYPHGLEEQTEKLNLVELTESLFSLYKKPCLKPTKSKLTIQPTKISPISTNLGRDRATAARL